MRLEIPDVPEKLSTLIADYRRRAGGIPPKILADGVRTLSAMFNGERPLAPGYLARHHLRQAYVVYYLVQTWSKVRGVLSELVSFAELPPSPRVLDFGCGPGAASLAAADALTRPLLTLHDIVGEALDDAAWLLGQHGGAGGKVRVAPDTPEGPFDLLLAANVLSEMKDPAPLERLMENALEPAGYLVLVEPALPDSARRVMAWRDRLVERGWRIAAPCAGAARCPMRERGDLWCHQDLPWNAPGFVDVIDRRLGYAKESLKFSYLLATQAGAVRIPSERPAWRVVSNRHRAKGRVWATLCGAGEKLVESTLLSRHRSPETADFEHVRRGDVLEISPPPEPRLPEGVRITRR